MAIIKCGECGHSVSDQAYVCPNCGRDVRVLKSNYCSCGNCAFYDSEDGCDYGPSGYPCLKYSEKDYD